MQIKATAPRKVIDKAGVISPGDVRDRCASLSLKADHIEDAEWLSAIYRHMVLGDPMPGRYPFAPEKS